MCNRELVQFQEVYPQFVERDTEILVVDPQELFRVSSMRKKLKSPFRFLSDPTAWVCAQYGVAKQLMVHQEWVNLPATFIVDKKGILRYAHVGRGWPMSERATPKEVLDNIPH